MSNPLVSVVICHHTGKLILDAVRSVLESKFVTPEIIVVTSDKDLIVNGVERLIVSTKPPATKRNIGIKFAKSKYVAFFDDDVEVTKYTIHHMLQTLMTEGVGMVFGKSLNMEFRNRFDEAGGFLTHTGFIWARAESGIDDIGQFNKTESIFAGKSATCMVRRDVFWKSGGFDESFGILGEESDLAWRIWLKGYTVMYEPKSVTYHAFNTRFKPTKVFYNERRVYYNGCRNYLHMLLKNAPVHLLLLALPCQITAWLLAAFGQLLHGRIAACGLILEALWSVVKDLRWFLEQRREIRSSIVGQEWSVLRKVMRDPPFSYYIKRLRSYVSKGLHG